MQGSLEKNFFEKIRRYVNISYFVSSIIPLALLAYFSIKYIHPYLEWEIPTNVWILLFLSVVISLLGLSLLTKTTNASLSSLQDIYVKLDTLIEITKQFRETFYTDILLENIVKSAMRLNSTRAGSLLMYDESGNLRFTVVVGEQGQRIKDRVLKRGEGISGWVAETGQPALINDVTKDSRYNPDFEREMGFKIKSIMCAPLIHNKNIIGVIEVLNKENGSFTKEDMNLLYSLADQAAISIAQSKAYESQHSDLIQIVEILVGAQDYHSPEKKGHARRVANYANRIGKEMGLSETDLKNLYYASLLHDIGFLKIDINEQWEEEKYIGHPQLGYEMIKPISLWKEAAEIILSHHERYDGTGYPLEKKGEEIPLGARILSVADIFDVLTNKYSYKKRLDYTDVVSEIEANSGLQFDPAVVKAFKSALKETDLISE
jgi:putative nucleotidyltransferase with HDIG domain